MVKLAMLAPYGDGLITSGDVLPEVASIAEETGAIP